MEILKQEAIFKSVNHFSALDETTYDFELLLLIYLIMSITTNSMYSLHHLTCIVGYTNQERTLTGKICTARKQLWKDSRDGSLHISIVDIVVKSR